MEENQREKFREAVEKKNEEAAAASVEAHEDQLADTDEVPDSQDPRAKSSRHGKVTADKWNQ